MVFFILFITYLLRFVVAIQHFSSIVISLLKRVQLIFFFFFVSKALYAVVVPRYSEAV